MKTTQPTPLQQFLKNLPKIKPLSARERSDLAYEEADIVHRQISIIRDDNATVVEVEVLLLLADGTVRDESYMTYPVA